MIKTITFVALFSVTLLYSHRVHGTFGNEYVHIKVHLPKDHTTIVGEPEASHKVIHHYHHKTKARTHAPKKPTVLQSPLLESVILSELDKPSHTNEHSEYLYHAKELAEHIAKPVETYVVKKQLQPPPKKVVNTYAIIEEKIKPHEHHDNYGHVETFKVIDTKLPIRHHQRHTNVYDQDEYEHEHENDDYDYAYKQTTSHQTHYDDNDDHGYEQEQLHYEPHEHRASHNRHHLHTAYAEPAPVEEAAESDDEYAYQPYQPQLQQQQQQQHYLYGHQTKYTNKRAPIPSESFTVPDKDASIDNYYGAGVDSVVGNADPFNYNKRPSYNVGAGLGSFRPSPQVHDAQKSSYDDYSLLDGYLATKRAPTHSASYSRPIASEIEWPESTGYNSAAAKTYSDIDSYTVGHQDVKSGNYQYASPYE